MKTKALFLTLLLSTAAWAAGDSLVIPKDSSLITVHLRSGKTYKGTLVSQTQDQIVLEIGDGRLTLDKSNISKMTFEGPDAVPSKGFPFKDPNHNSLFLMPTAETSPARTFYISNYELFYMNLGVSFTDNLQAGVGFLFPVTSEFLSEGPKTLGLKYRFYHDPGRLHLAMQGSTTFMNEISFHSLGVGSCIELGPLFRFNLYLGDMIMPESRSQLHNFNWSIGADLRVSESVKLMMEILSFTQIEEDLGNIAIFGVRFFGKSLSCDLGGLRFLGEDMGELFLWPFLNFTYTWSGG